MNKNGLLADEARSNEVMQAECSNTLHEHCSEALLQVDSPLVTIPQISLGFSENI